MIRAWMEQQAALVDLSRELDAITDGDKVARRGVLEAAIELSKLGIAGREDVNDMVRMNRLAAMHGVTEADVRALGQIKRRGRVA